MGYFQKFAKETDVWLNLPDPGERIRSQGIRHMQDMENVQNSIRRENQVILDRYAQIERMEEENHKTNWELRKAYRDTEKEAERKQHKTVLNNIEVEELNRKQRANDWAQLAAFTKTGTQFLKERDQQNKDNAMLEWRQFHDEFGITSADLNAVASIDKHQWNKSRSDNAVWQGLRARGIPENLIEKMRGINSYGKLAVSSIDAQNLARTWGTVLASNKTKFNIAGREVDWNTAYTSRDPIILRQVMRMITKEEMAKHGPAFPSTKIWEYSGAARIKREIEHQFLNKQQNLAIKEAHKTRHEDEWKLLESLTNKYQPITDDWTGAKGFQLAVDHKAGPNPTREALNTARKEMAEAYAAGIIEGRISWQDGEELLKAMIRPKAHGENGPLVAWGAHFFKDGRIIQAAIDNRITTDYGRLQAQQKAAKMDIIKMELDYREIVKGTKDISLETLTGLHAAAIKAHGMGTHNTAANYIQSRINAQNITINDGINKGYVLDAIAAGKHLTRENIEALKMSPALTEQMWALVQENNNYIPDKNSKEILDDVIEKELIKRIPQNRAYGEQSTRLAATKGAYKRATFHYTNARKLDKSHAEALDYATQKIRQDIWNDQDEWAVTTPGETTGGVREFKGFLGSSSLDIGVADLPKLRDQLANNPGAIYSAPFLSREKLLAKSQKLNSGAGAGSVGLLDLAPLYANYGNNKYSPLQVELAQIEYHNAQAKINGTELIPEYPKEYINSVQKAEEIVHPLALKYLSTPGYVNQAVVKQGRNPVYQDYSTTKVDKMLFGDTDYNTVTLPEGTVLSTDETSGLGFHITNANCQQADQISLGQNAALGRYALQPGTILEGCELAGISPLAKFNKENQDKIFKALFKKHGLSLYDNDQLSDKDRFYIQRTHEMMNGEQLSDLGYNDPALLSPLAYQIKWDLGVYHEGATV